MERLSTPTSILDVRAATGHHVLVSLPVSCLAGRLRNTHALSDSICSLFKDEPRAHPIFHPIHLAAYDAEQCSGIDQDAYPVLFDDLVEFALGVGGQVGEVVGESGAATVTDRDAEELGFSLFCRCRR